VVALSAALIAFGNLKSWWDLVVLHTTAAGSTFDVGAGILLVLAILAGGVLVRTDFGALGLSGGTWQSSLRLGVWIGGTAALASGVLIVGGALVARGLGLDLATVTPAASAPWGPLLWRAVLLLWVDTAIPEELGFRGALLLTLDGQRLPEATPGGVSYTRAWVQVARASIRPAVLVSSVVFAAWHVVVVVQDGTPDAATIVAKLAVIAIGGLLFGGLRLVGGNLLAPVVGHWLFDMVAMIAARLAVSL
jgi:membrane protease YdiL (CAAX protease family)